MKDFISASIDRITLLIVKARHQIDNPSAYANAWKIPASELENRIKGMTMVLNVIKENPNPGSGSHNARFEGLILATINSLKLKGDKSELCGILVGMSQAVNAYNQARKELSNLKSA